MCSLTCVLFRENGVYFPFITGGLGPSFIKDPILLRARDSIQTSHCHVFALAIHVLLIIGEAGVYGDDVTQTMPTVGVIPTTQCHYLADSMIKCKHCHMVQVLALMPIYWGNFLSRKYHFFSPYANEHARLCMALLAATPVYVSSP